MELELGEHERSFPLANKVIQQAYYDVGEQWGIEYPSIAVNALLKNSMNNTEDTEKGQIARLAIRKAVEVAEFLKIPIIQLPSFIDGEIKSNDDFEHTKESIRYACDLVKDKEIIIGTENLLSTDENKRMLNEVNSPHLKVFFE